MTPTQVNNLLWQRGLPDVGEWLQRRAATRRRTSKDRVDQLKLQVLELEQLLPPRREGTTRKRAAARACSCVACQLRRWPQSTARVRRLNYGSLPWPWRTTRTGNFPLFLFEPPGTFHASCWRSVFIADAADAEPDDAKYRRLSRAGPHPTTADSTGCRTLRGRNNRENQ
jgi:hypothetical protein